ncbi:MAG: hypothetical protein ACRD44_07795 [Bryobacteraceae bacterium]
MKARGLCFVLATAACGWGQIGGRGVAGRGFQGPAILSRGYGSLGRSVGAPLAFRPYISVSSFYRTGLTAVSTDNTGQLFDQKDYGMMGSLGAYLYHLGNHKTISLDYATHLRYHRRYSYHFGNDHFLALRYQHQVSARTSYSIALSGTTFTNGFGRGGMSLDGSQDNSLGFGFGNFGFVLHDPSQQVFDARIYAVSANAGMAYQKSARWVFAFAGGGYMTRFQSQALTGSQGARASGSASYALGERSTIGVHYGYGLTTFRGAYGELNSHQVGMHFGRALGPRWQFSLSGGVFQSEVTRLATTTLDPLIARLLGTAVQVQPFYRKNYGLAGSASLSRSFERSTLSLHYMRGVTPGNGVVNGAQRDRFSAGYTFTALRNLSIGTSAGFDRQKSLFDASNKYHSYYGGAGTTYRLFSIVHAVVRVDYRRFELTSSQFSRNQMNAYGGLALSYSPGEIPLSLW